MSEVEGQEMRAPERGREGEREGQKKEEIENRTGKKIYRDRVGH